MHDNIAVQRLLEGLLDTPWEEDKAAKEDEEQDDAHRAELKSKYLLQSLQKYISLPTHCVFGTNKDFSLPHIFIHSY